MKQYIISQELLDRTLMLIASICANKEADNIYQELDQLPDASIAHAEKILADNGYCMQSVMSTGDIFANLETYNDRNGTDYTMSEEDAKSLLNDIYGNYDYSAQNELLYEAIATYIEEREGTQ